MYPYYLEGYTSFCAKCIVMCNFSNLKEERDAVLEFLNAKNQCNLVYMNQDGSFNLEAMYRGISMGYEDDSNYYFYQDVQISGNAFVWNGIKYDICYNNKHYYIVDDLGDRVLLISFLTEKFNDKILNWPDPSNEKLGFACL